MHHHFANRIYARKIYLVPVGLKKYIVIKNICYFVACAVNCKKCDTTGTTKCDAGECAEGYTLISEKCEGKCFDGCVKNIEFTTMSN